MFCIASERGVFANATSEQIAHITRILELLDGVRVSAKLQNRRRSKRVTIRTMMEAVLLNEDLRPTVKIYTRNLSTAGIGFVSRRLFKRGERMMLTFEAGGQAKRVLVEMTFCRYVAGAMYEAGGEFVDCVPVGVEIPPQWGAARPRRRR